MRKKKQRGDEGADDWMATYGDMVTLLLTFFLMLFSISTFAGAKGTRAALKEIAGSFDFPVTWKKEMKEEAIVGKLEESADFTQDERNELLDIIDKLLKVKDRYKDIEVKVTDLGLVVTAKSPIFFDIGRADLKPASHTLLDIITEIYQVKECELSVYGYTCDLPIHTRQFPSNKELSCARALSVVKYFQNIGIEGRRLSATGCADTYPVAENTCEANRKLNRRVEIYIDFGSKKILEIEGDKVKIKSSEGTFGEDSTGLIQDYEDTNTTVK